MWQTAARWEPRLVTVAFLALPQLVLPPAPAPAHVADPADFQQVTLAKGVAEMGEPMSLAVLPDRSVLHTARDGTVRLTDASGNTEIAGKLAVYTHDEEGLQGVAVDPGFAPGAEAGEAGAAANRFVYLYYAPRLNTPSGDAPETGTDFSAWRGVNRLSRFVLRTDGTLDMASERRILDVPADRGLCCHVGGDIDFDAAGNLYLSTGDDSNPFEAGGYTPIDERADRNPSFDAQRTAANTDDLRGKVLRIKVNPDGSYSIPPGNLFAPGTPRTRPEIYAMGLRNPFRMNVDKRTGTVYLGEHGPDAGSTDPARGPGGQVEFNRITRPGFYGWPYCTGTNTAAETYNRYDFATGESGAKFSCAAPQNRSPRNTGRTTLPPAQPAWIKYDGCDDPEFDCPDNRKGESPMSAPVYRYDPASASDVRFPESLDGHLFLGEFGRRWIKAVDVNLDGSRGAVSPFPWQGTQTIDMAFGPDGALYVLDYGTGYFNGDENSALYRIEYARGRNRAPLAVADADRTSGVAPLTVSFSSKGSSDPEGGALAYAWRFGDGGAATTANPSHTFRANGRYTVSLTVRDAAGAEGTANVIVTVGNTAPTVTLELPADGQLFSFGDTVPFRVRVADREDGTVDCARVEVTYILGHDSHGHPITSASGCTGSIRVPADGEHDPSANLHGVFDAEYTDRGAGGQPPLTTHTQHIVQPRHRQAEHHGDSSGIEVVPKTAAEGGHTVGYISHGDWFAFRRYLPAGATSFEARVSSAGSGGVLSLRAGSPTGPVLGSVTVPATGDWARFVTVAGAISWVPSAPTTLYLVGTGSATEDLFDVDSFTFTTADAAGPPPGGRRKEQA
jgi:glucose/arabinose dehydrogenase